MTVEEIYRDIRPFEKSDHLSVESPVRTAFMSTIQPDLTNTLMIYDASRFPTSFQLIISKSLARKKLILLGTLHLLVNSFLFGI